MIFYNIRRRKNLLKGKRNKKFLLLTPWAGIVRDQDQNCPGPGPKSALKLLISKKNSSKCVKIVFCINKSNFSDGKSTKKSVFMGVIESRSILVPIPVDSWSRSRTLFGPG